MRTGTWRGGYRRALIFILPVLLASPVAIRAAGGAQGHWQGAIELPGAALEVQVQLQLSETEGWTGSISIPAQGAKDLPLVGVKVDGAAVVFAIANVPGEPAFEGTLDGGEISGTFTQAGQSFPFKLQQAAAARPSRPQEPKGPVPYQEQEVSFTNGDVILSGTLTLPAGKGPFPGALLVSGSGPQDRNEEVFDHRPFLVLADHLTRAGIAVLRVDDRGVGKSTGDRLTGTSKDFAADALAGVRFLQSRSEVDAAKVGIIGHSEGGLIGPLVASGSDAVAFVVMLAGPGVPGSKVIVRQTELIARAAGLGGERVAAGAKVQRELLAMVASGAPDHEVRAKVRELVKAQTGAETLDATMEAAADREAARLLTPWFRFFLGHDPRPVLSKVKVPVLALIGEKDLQVDPEQNLPEIEKALEAGGNQDHTVVELPGLNHLFQEAGTGSPSEYYTIEETFNPKALTTISDWILERLGPRSDEGEWQ